MSISDLLANLELAPERLAVECNMLILKRDQWSARILLPGDRLEIVHFVGGGLNSVLLSDS